jgi:hypothetical protein
MCLLELESWARANYMLVSTLRCTGSTRRTLIFPVADRDAVVGVLWLDCSCVLLLNLCNLSLWTALEIPASFTELNDGSMLPSVSRRIRRAFKLEMMIVWVLYASQWQEHEQLTWPGQQLHMIAPMKSARPAMKKVNFTCWALAGDGAIYNECGAGGNQEFLFKRHLSQFENSRKSLRTVNRQAKMRRL